MRTGTGCVSAKDHTPPGLMRGSFAASASRGQPVCSRAAMSAPRSRRPGGYSAHRPGHEATAWMSSPSVPREGAARCRATRFPRPRPGRRRDPGGRSAETIAATPQSVAVRTAVRREREKSMSQSISPNTPVARAIDARQSNAVVVSLVPIAYKCLSVLRKICPCEMATELRVYSPTAFSARISNFGPVANTEVTPSSLVT